MAQDWDIKPRGSVCHACEKDFQDRQSYHSILVFEESGYRRADYCETCWSGASARNEPYSSWQGVFRVPPPPPPEALKKETAESLLRKLIEEENETNRNVIFILAVMLERKKLLAEKDVQTREDGSTVRVYEHRKTGDTFIVPDPRLRFDQIEDVQRQVMAMLDGAAAAATAPVEGGPAPAGDVPGAAATTPAEPPAPPTPPPG